MGLNGLKSDFGLWAFSIYSCHVHILTPSQREEGCRGFTVEILEEVPEGEDIIAHEDLWIRYIDPELGVGKNTDKSALYTMYRLELMYKLLSGGKSAVSFE